MGKITYFGIFVLIVILLLAITSNISNDQESKTNSIINSDKYISENGCKYTKLCIFDRVYIQGCMGTAIFLDDDGHPITCKKGEFK